MSAYIVGNETIYKIVTMVRDDPYFFEEFKKFVKDVKLFEFQLGKALLKLNINACDQRYRDNPYLTKKEIKQELENLGFQEYYLYNNVEKIKTLSCFLYQCSEGNIDKTKLYKTLERFKNHLAMEIVYKDPKWDSYEWG